MDSLLLSSCFKKVSPPHLVNFPSNNLASDVNYTLFNGWKHFASGICVGFSSLGAGLAIGIVGDAGVRANAQEPRIFVGMILILIFGEAIGLYGLIIAIILS